MTFRGWPVEAIEFFEGLEDDNSRAYWQAHKATYEQSVKAPMEELLAELEHDFGPGKVFRPYRDVRFSSDKTPYKLNCAAHLAAATSRCRPTSSSWEAASTCRCPPT